MEAQTLELIELFEETIFTEGTDPEWSGLAELALDEASKREEMTEFSLVDAKCGTTMCRMELSQPGRLRTMAGRGLYPYSGRK